MWEMIPPCLRPVCAAERALLKYLAEHVEDRLLVGVVLDISDFQSVENQQIYSEIMDLPLAAGNHSDHIGRSLLSHTNTETIAHFSTFRDAPTLGGWTVALQLAAYLLLQASSRRDAEEIFSLLDDASEEELW